MYVSWTKKEENSPRIIILVGKVLAEGNSCSFWAENMEGWWSVNSVLICSCGQVIRNNTKDWDCNAKSVSEGRCYVQDLGRDEWRL